jgi:hypothetical protein
MNEIVLRGLYPIAYITVTSAECQFTFRTIPHCVDNWLIDGGDVSLMHGPRFTLHEYFYFCPWYSFLLEAE